MNDETQELQDAVAFTDALDKYLASIEHHNFTPEVRLLLAVAYGAGWTDSQNG